ncbi:MAG: RNA polymerase subunit sigma-24, partial [Pseudomonadales bacterium]|nr:RNA polymerase subunit sigma-24 [Pseudomonadales bacterium]
EDPLPDNEIDDQHSDIDDDVLRLIFMCCHPAIAAENQLALTLKTVLGFSQKEIAKAFLIKEATLEQRLTRSKRKIAASGILFEMPADERLDKRLPPVQQVLYLIFNEGYHGSSGELLNETLCHNAIALTRSLCRALPEPENLGLLALMLFQDARAPARMNDRGELVTLDKQNRGLWRQPQIAEADVLLQKALRRKQSGVYQLQAAIAGLHSLAPSAEKTDWLQIVGLYRLLMQHQGGPVITLNYAVALLFADKLDQAATLIKQLENELENYSPYWAARAKLAELLGSDNEASKALQKALSLSGSKQESKHYQLQLLKQHNQRDLSSDSIH